MARRRRIRAIRRRGKKSATSIMGLIGKFMNPIFSFIALDLLDRQLNTMLLSPNFALKIPVVARAAMSLTFTLFRLKISERFTKGLPFGMGSIANFALRLSGLQIALSNIGVFFDPKNYEVPGGGGGGWGLGMPPSAGIPIQSILPSAGYQVGDYVCVSVGADAGKCGTITSIQSDGDLVISGIINEFPPSLVVRG